MQSLVCDQPRHLTYRDDPMPQPKQGEVLLRVTHVGICGTDLHAFEGNQPYFSYPRILGHELAAVVEDNSGSINFANGEAVTIMPYFSCGLCIACRKGKTNCCVSMQVFGVHIDGGMREYITVSETALIKSGGLNGEQLALIEPLAIGAHGIRVAAVQENETVLIIGAGPIGLGTMMMAKLNGAKVLAMDVSDSRLAFAIQHGYVDEIIHPSHKNVLEEIRELTNGDMPDVVIDCTGNKEAINLGFSFISHGGRYVLIGLQKEEIVFSHPEFHKRESTLMSSRNATRQDFDQVIDAILNKQIDVMSMISHRTRFSDVRREFSSWHDPANGVIKAMVEF